MSKEGRRRKERWEKVGEKKRRKGDGGRAQGLTGRQDQGRREGGGTHELRGRWREGT